MRKIPWMGSKTFDKLFVFFAWIWTRKIFLENDINSAYFENLLKYTKYWFRIKVSDTIYIKGN